VKADLCTDGDRGKGVDHLDVYLVIYPRAEQGDEVGVGGVEGLAARDVSEEILPYELILWAPNFPSLFVEDGVEVRVSRRWVSAWWSSKKVWKKVEVVGDFIDRGRRLYGGGSDGQRVAKRQGWAPDDIFG